MFVTSDAMVGYVDEAPDRLIGPDALAAAPLTAPSGIDVFNLEQIRDSFPVRYEISFWCMNLGNFFASISVGGTFLYLGKLLR